MRRNAWRVVVVLACVGTVGSTAHAKFAEEIYPSVLFPSFGNVLEADETRPGAETTLLLHSGDNRLTVATAEWFDGAPHSALDRLSGKLVDLSDDNSAWMFGRADTIAGTCVYRIDVMVAAEADAAVNQFVRDCQ